MWRMSSLVLFLHFVITSQMWPGSTAQTQSALDQGEARDATWRWNEDITSPLNCYTGGYDLRLDASGKVQRVVISLLDNGKIIYSWVGHCYSVFMVADNRLYYAKFRYTAPGGSIVAVDLKSGKEIWNSKLEGAAPPMGFSGYSNRMNLDVQGPIVILYGEESGGRRYVEYKDSATGKTVGHKLFPYEAQTLPSVP